MIALDDGRELEFNATDVSTDRARVAEVRPKESGRGTEVEKQ